MEKESVSTSLFWLFCSLFITKCTGFEGDGPIYLSILLLLAIDCLFTVAEGRTAVIWTDCIQTSGAIFLAIQGILLITVFRFNNICTTLAFVHEDVGCYEGLVDKTATIRASTTPSGSELRDATPGCLIV